MALSLGLSTLGASISVVGWLSYLATISEGKVPTRPVAGLALALGGMALATGALVLGAGSKSARWPLAIGLSSLALALGGLFVLVYSQRRTPVGEIRVQVGAPLPRFRSQTAGGRAFDSQSLAGQRVLLKFFRGSW